MELRAGRGIFSTFAVRSMGVPMTSRQTFTSRLVSCGLIAAMFAALPSHAQNLITNGGFEQPGFSLNPNYRYLTGSNATLLTGWTWQYDGVNEPSYVYHSSRYPVFAGSYSVALNDGDAAQTSFATERGCSYVLSFVTLGDDGGRLRVQAGAGGLDVEINPKEIGVGTGVFYDQQNEWIRVTLPFQALAEQAPLIFSDAPQSRPYGGRVLDEVVVAEGPAILRQPADAIGCIPEGVEARLDAVGVELAYQWQVQDSTAPSGWQDLSDGPLWLNGANWGTVSGARSTKCVFLHAAGDSVQGPLTTRCIISDVCGSVPSEPAELRICLANINCDSEVDLADFLGFFNCYDAEQACADIDAIEGTDLGDFLTFFNAYDAGC